MNKVPVIYGASLSSLYSPHAEDDKEYLCFVCNRVQCTARWGWWRRFPSEALQSSCAHYKRLIEMLHLSLNVSQDN